MNGSCLIDEDRFAGIGHCRAENHPVVLKQEHDSVRNLRNKRLNHRFGHAGLDALSANNLLQATEESTDPLNFQSGAFRKFPEFFRTHFVYVAAIKARPENCEWLSGSVHALRQIQTELFRYRYRH
jgi:hypothetical protein